MVAIKRHAVSPISDKPVSISATKRERLLEDIRGCQFRCISDTRIQRKLAHGNSRTPDSSQRSQWQIIGLLQVLRLHGGFSSESQKPGEMAVFFAAHVLVSHPIPVTNGKDVAKT